MTKKFDYPDTPINRGKVLWEDELEKIKDKWGRYIDLDGDGIPYRTVMGNTHEKAPYFSRGTGHDEFGKYSEDPEVKFTHAREQLPLPVTRYLPDAKIGLIGMGSTEPAILEAQDKLAEMGIVTDFLRVRSLPFSSKIRDFIQSHEHNYVLELNRDGQLHQILTIDFCDMTHRLISLSYIDGLPMTAKWIIESILAKETI